MNKLTFFILAFGAGTSLQAQTLKDANLKTENERYDLARKEYQKLISVDPASVENAFFFGNFYQTIGEKDSAITLWRKAGNINIEDKLARISAAKAIYFSGDTMTAGQQFCEIIKDSKKKNPMVYFRIAETYATGPLKNLKLAETYLNAAIKLDPKNIDQFVLLGDVLLAQSTSNASRATEQYNNALAINPNEAKVITRKAQIYQRVQNYKLANEEYQKAQAADPNYAPAYRENAELNILFNQYKAAIECWEKYLKLNDSEDARYRYATSLFGANQFCNVLPQIETLEKANFVNLYTKRMKFYSLYECNESGDSLNYVAALNASTEFFKICPADKVISVDYKYVALINQKLKNKDAAITAYFKAADIDTAKAGDYINEIAKIYSADKNYPKLIETYTMKEAKYPSKMQANDYYELGRAYYFGPKNYAMADSAFTKLTVLSPTYAGGYFWKARAQAQRDTDPKTRVFLAKPSYELFLANLTEADFASGSYNSYIVEANKYLGDYYVNSKEGKDYEKAKICWGKVQELVPGDAQAKAFFASPAGK
jgi:Tfp pilus assembly protein PilF